MTKKILIFIATYNENLNISNLFKSIINLSKDYEILHSYQNLHIYKKIN